MNVLLGISASGGIGIGNAFVLPETPERVIYKNRISDEEVEYEWSRFESACIKVKESIEKSLSGLSQEDLNRVILETYLLMLADPVFLQEVKVSFEKNKYNIEYTLSQKVDEYADRLRNSGNDYLAERAGDIEDVFGQVLDILLDYHPFNIELVPENAVIVGRNMKTSDTVILNKRKIAGLALIEGGSSSHVAILARTYGIPAVVGLDGITSQVETGQQIVVDGNLGEVVVAPDSATLMQSQSKIVAEQKRVERLKEFRNKPAMTEDGVVFKLYANIGTPEEAEVALEEGADGIGLFRTEFLFMDSMKANGNKNASYSNSVSEEVQFQAYKRVLEIMGDKPVTIRTLDSGGDKDIGSKEIPSNVEKNPLMGLRAIRHSLFYPQVFRTQLRALYRASVYGNMRIMLPLITDVSQVDTVLGIIKGVQYSLKEDNIPFRADVPVGIMIETAAAAICADCFATHCDFFSLGTNDLTQYTIGIDRENPSVAPYYNEFNLAVLRLIKMTIDAAKHENIPVSICGEMAGKKESVIILAGLGIRELSMAPKQISVIKEILSQFSIEELENLSSNSIF
ncbi:phosphoenolpyruvate--protein phosphotransferase [Treponema sp.]|uniref:phosphoenolpyruvate--protein phosphotransferase n=1 Tax=Treponema sp. TaxID=166 RepID=UPI00257F2BE4|nr:phosphoenolpyruvate--protein phosphotransferase [Treponema sp.]MBE6355151.1 phosphoenolpyruvate--protein phosphotransferase [Treponema sp.]